MDNKRNERKRTTQLLIRFTPRGAQKKLDQGTKLEKDQREKPREEREGKC